MSINLILPFPVSVNAMYASVPRGKKIIRIKSQRYSAWKAKASASLYKQYVGGLHSNPVVLQINLCPRDLRIRDLDNHAKAIQDLLSGVVLEDDSQIKMLCMSWLPPEKEPYALVTINALDDPRIANFVSSFNDLKLDNETECAKQETINNEAAQFSDDCTASSKITLEGGQNA